MKKKGRIGSSFDDFLKQEGIYEEVTARAIKRVIARQLDVLMADEGITKSELAKRMKTSRAQLDRLLDPENESVTLGTLNVTVSPWADVYLDGFHLGQTPLAGRQVAAAPHQLRLVGPNGEKSLQIEVKQTETLVVREALP